MTESKNIIRDIIHGRLSAERFERGRALSEEVVRELVEDAIHAPSSFNIQHWRFVVVRNEADKKRLKAAAYDQAVVEDAAVTLIVLGDVRAHESLEQTLDESVRAGAMSRDAARRWVELSDDIYADEHMARDEALRSASLAAMVLMLSAAARGLASAPLIGFDAEAVRRDFEIPEHCLPVMLLAIGYPVDGAPRGKVRLAVDRVLAFDRGNVF